MLDLAFQKPKNKPTLNLWPKLQRAAVRVSVVLVTCVVLGACIGAGISIANWIIHR